MKIRAFVLILAIFIVPISAYCTEKLESLEAMETRYGLVSMGQGKYTLSNIVYFNKKKLPVDEGSGHSIKKKWVIGSKDILLVSEYSGGNACPANYFFLIVTKNQIVISEIFGNCSEMPEISRIKDTILVKFPRGSRYAPAETVQYDNGKAYGMIKRIINGKMVANPGELKMKTIDF